MIWRLSDDTAIFAEGWGIFKRPDGKLYLQALVNPHGVNADRHRKPYRYKGPVFKCDESAAAHAMRLAEEGHLAARKAIEYLVLHESPSVKMFHLKVSWK
jgi:hypothetical protein